MAKRMDTCCFTGHRNIPEGELPSLKQRLNEIIESLIHKGVIYYGCGGARGFDMLAGFCVLGLRERYPAVKLILVLPCRDQDARWSPHEKEAFQKLLAAADKRVYMAQEYYEGCMRKRNLHLTEHSGYCVAYMKHDRSGTAQTVRFAKERGLTVINLAEG